MCKMQKNIWMTITCVGAIFVGIANSDDVELSGKDIADRLVVTAHQLMKDLDFHSLPLPTMKHNILGRSTGSNLVLSRCEVYNLATMSRDAVKTKTWDESVDIKATLGFKDVQIKCGYTLSLLAKNMESDELVINIPYLKAITDISYTPARRDATVENVKLSGEGVTVRAVNAQTLILLMQLLKDAKALVDNLLEDSEKPVAETLQEVLDVAMN